MFFWECSENETSINPFLKSQSDELSFRELFAQGDRLFSGLNRGVCLILCGKNFESVIGYIGALRNNIVPLILSQDITLKSLSGYIRKYNPEHIFLRRGFQELPGYEIVGQCQSYDLLANKQKLLGQKNLYKHLALLLPTSGSTGDPKCVRITRRNLQSSVESISEYLQIDNTDVAISILPFNYSYGLSVLNCQLFKRGALVLTDLSVLDRGLWKLIREKKVTSFSAVPFVYKMLRRMKLDEIFPGTLRTMTQAGGRLDAKLTSHFLEFCKSRNANYFTMYGQTEASPRISYVPPQDAYKKLGSVGIPVPGGKAYIKKDDLSGSDNREGELIYEGENVCLGYANSREDLNKLDDFKGILRTGDQAEIDEDGYIYIVGRRKRFIKTQGNSINLDFVESILNEKGYECAVVGKDDFVAVCLFEGDLEEMKIFFSEHFEIHVSNVKFISPAERYLNEYSKTDYVQLENKYL